MYDVVIIGAGPYGISLAAHAAAHKLNYKLLGYPMDFWKNQMPQNMFIRTPHDFCSFADAHDELSIERYAEATGTELVTPLPRPIFVDYAMWFAREAGVEFTPELVTSVTLRNDIYLIETETGERLSSRNVIIATGVEHYKYVPDLLRRLPDRLVSHTLGYTDFGQYAGQRVAVIGSGQSAWEAAALLHNEGSSVELLYRRASAHYAGSREAEIEIREMGEVFYQLPLAQKQEEWGQSPGSVAHFLRPYVEGKIPETGGVQVVRAQASEDTVILTLSDGTTREVDHVISASGFRINLDRVPFLGEDVRSWIEREEGYPSFPRLNAAFESSQRGLYFAGPLSSHSHGPTFRFILGLKKTSRSIMASLTAAEANKLEQDNACTG
ncbi:NAD(P)-binding domain-containing protein [Paenibacillus sp. JX-17]|uniref:NAD(P)-binding domain-containing protein n=1 Tax=Paenibacillus lacisoli TaxID=3064525 RepID=A0ABT9CHG4_9BACL|nr:NAD(P)-binding domain-containing protein [Paenibacillus sp. JX-17]MDO7908719.1 NAD(P)-binding domain-containing protein [Paenibacillus sp. JX-17]